MIINLITNNIILLCAIYWGEMISTYRNTNRQIRKNIFIGIMSA